MTVRHQLPGGGFLALGKGGKGWLEASATRAHGGSNVEAMSVPEALASMREAYREAKQFCTPTRDGAVFEHSDIVRLDVVRGSPGRSAWTAHDVTR